MTSTYSVFNIGKHSTKLINIAANEEVSPPKPLLIGCPIKEGEYPVLMLLHGYLLNNTFSTLILFSILLLMDSLLLRRMLVCHRIVLLLINLLLLRMIIF